MENHSSIEQKIKRLAAHGAIFAFIASIVSIFAAFILAEMEMGLALGLVIGLAVASAVVLVGYITINSTATAWTAEIKNEAAQLTTAVSAIAEGNFSAMLTDSSSELGQIGEALAQLMTVQRALTKDMEALSRRGLDNGELVDERQYSGNYRDMVKGVNSLVTDCTAAAATITEALRALAKDDFSLPYSYKFAEAGTAVQELRKKLEAMGRELRDAASVAEKASAEAEEARTQLRTAREEAEKAREEANNARHEATTARNEAATARREAERAARGRIVADVSPRTSFFKPKAVVSQVSQVSQSERPTLRAVASGVKKADSVKKDDGAKKIDSAKKTDGTAPVIKSIKVSAPSSAHIYDSRDFGKY
ncbi:MAG: hypothetical protein FWG87_00060 [Defluviitaleaceae bacterium]|nr:hypothetical protein [Defluviitaleaceae bacterium]